MDIRNPLMLRALLFAATLASACSQAAVQDPTLVKTGDIVNDQGVVVDVAQDAAADDGADQQADAAAACKGQAGCPAGQACLGGVCAAGTACKSHKTCAAFDAVCDLETGLCVQCNDQPDCPSDMKCADHVCQAPPKACSSSKDCGSSQVCDTVQSVCVDCLTANDCGDGQDCVANLCVTKLCPAGAALCKNSQIKQVCQEGSWVEVACASDEACDGGECAVLVCEIGSTKCEAGASVPCNDLGTAWLAPVVCGAEQSCIQGVCVDKTCTPGQKTCAGNTIQTCDAQGQSQLKPCATGQVCTTEDGAPLCKPLICKPNTKSCVGNAVAVCSASGTAKVTGAACPSVATCSDGACVLQKPCAPGEITCADSSTLATCLLDGSAATVLACGTGKTCSAGKCIDPVCASGTTQCAGNKVQTCTATGLWQDSSDCSTLPGTCQAGACVSSKCGAGEYTCLNGVPAVCDQQGIWLKQAACPGNQVCVNKGECKGKICDAGAAYCQGNLVMKCDATGTLPITVDDCAFNGQVCKDGSCVTGAKLCAPGAKQCSANWAQVCNSFGTAWVDQICDDGNPCTSDGCAGGVCTKTAMPDGASCSGKGSGCEVFACSSGVCTSQGAGLWQKVLGAAGGTGTPYRAQALPDGSVQWVGTWVPAGSTSSAGWLARTSATGSITASWPISGGANAAATVWTPLGTWTAQQNSLLFINNSGAPELQVVIPPPPNYGWPSIVSLAVHPQGGVVVVMTSSTGASGFQADVVRVTAVGSVAWRTKVPLLTGQGVLDVAANGEVRLITTVQGLDPTPSYVFKLTADGQPSTPQQIAGLPWPGWTDLQAVTLPASGTGLSDRIVSGRTFAPCQYCGSNYTDVGVVRFTPEGAVVWAVPLVNTLGVSDQVGGIWQEGDTLVVVSSLGTSQQAGWIWTRMRVSDGKVVFSKNWNVVGNLAGYVPVAAPSGSGAVLALHDPNTTYSMASLFRVDAWGNPGCTESAGCASQTYAGCDDGNPCTFENCLAGVCLHTAATDGLSCGVGKTCGSGACK